MQNDRHRRIRLLTEFGNQGIVSVGWSYYLNSMKFLRQVVVFKKKTTKTPVVNT